MNLVRYVPVILRRPFWSLGGAASLAALIAIVDALVSPNLSLGFLYLLPLLLVAPHLGRRGLLGLSVGFGFLRESFAPFAWEPAAEERIFATFSAFAGVSLFVNELIRGRRIAVEFSRALEEQQTMRVEAEAQLTNFVESRPAAILTVGTDGRILQANQAAHQLFACDGDALTSEAVTRYLPTLHSVLASGGHRERIARRWKVMPGVMAGSRFRPRFGFPPFHCPRGCGWRPLFSTPRRTSATANRPCSNAPYARRASWWTRCGTRSATCVRPSRACSRT